MENLQRVTLEDYKEQIWTCANCYCGMCVHHCPAYNQGRNEALSARGLFMIVSDMLNGEVDFSELTDELIYTCTGCGWCEWNCSANTLYYIRKSGTRKTKVATATLLEILRGMRVEKGQVPEVVKDVLDNIGKIGNPYGKSKDVKDKWVQGLGCEFRGEDTLLYVGSMVPYEGRSTRIAEALIDVFRKAGFKFSMLGSGESDSGALVRYMGEEDLFEELVEANSKLLKEKGIKQIICLSPHDYDAFLSYYGFDDIIIKHYTEVLLELIKDGKIKLSKNVNKTVTYQDPCYLGRKHDIYDQPREILKSIPGLELVEMYLTRETAYCCGGGGAGLWYELPRIHMNYTRADHAKDVNGDYLAVACPGCLQMLDDGVKFKNYNIVVKDIAEIVLEAL